MKTGIFALCLFVSGLVHAQSDFKKSFQDAFLASIKGLETLKGNVLPDGWETSLQIQGFRKTIIVRDDNAGALAVRFSAPTSDLESAERLLAEYQEKITAALPQGDYSANKSYGPAYEGSMKTVFAFNSGKMADQQKRPIIEMGIIAVSGGFELVVLLYEPFFKNQYSPVMP